jgi:hypothetical protein
MSSHFAMSSKSAWTLVLILATVASRVVAVSVAEGAVAGLEPPAEG